MLRANVSHDTFKAMNSLPYMIHQLWIGFVCLRRLRRFIVCGWILMGLFPIIVVSAMGIAHFGYGVPVRDQDTGQFMTALKLVQIIFLGDVVGAFWLVLGVLLYRRARN